jgi:hypothetical protein
MLLYANLVNKFIEKTENLFFENYNSLNFKRIKFIIFIILSFYFPKIDNMELKNMKN